jgi:hypothetical protein
MQILRQAQYVKHGQYGLGVVTDSNAERTTIDFDLHGLKKFVTQLMVVELMAGEAPKKPAQSRPKRMAAKLAAARSKVTPTASGSSRS